MKDLTSKKNVLALAIVSCILELVASGRTWVTGSLNDGAVSSNAVDVSGNQAIPGFFGIALVGTAGMLAAATSGRIVRWIAGVLGVLGSMALVGVTVKVLADPNGAVKSRMSVVTGHTGEAVAHGTFTAWMWVAAFAAALNVIASVLGLLGLRRWAGLSSRYEAPVDAEKAPEKQTSDWDLMNAGIDPTDDAERSTQRHTAE